jgi:molybdenum cofactor guanylyltransferase
MTGDATPIAAFILAGGESSRMGSNKALLELGGVPLIVHMARLVESTGTKPIVVGSPEIYSGLRLRAIRDDWPGAGPLGAIATALRASESQWNLIVACDLPYLTKPWLEHLIHRAKRSHEDVVLPLNHAGAEPLCAMYNRTAESAIWLALDRGIRKVTDGLAGLHVEHIEPREWKAFDSEGLLFKNMNSAADYEEAKTRIGARSKQ